MAGELTTEVDGRVLGLSNLDKVLYPQAGFTKAEVISYYLHVAPTLLPHVRDRALTRIRFPDGTPDGAITFYEKNRPPGCPPWLRSAPVRTSDGIVDYLVVEDAACLVYLANLASLELHVPQWRLSSAMLDADGVVTLPGHDPIPGDPMADLVVVDLDPGEGITMVDSAQAALLVAAELAGDGLIPVVRTTGSKGLQVAAAIAPSSTEEARKYVKAVGETVTRRHPDRFVVTMSKAQRTGKIYVDYNQNMAARNTIAPYSLRGRVQPWVATPVTWDEIGAATGPTDLRFTADQVLQRIAEHGDLAADLLISDRPPLPDRRPTAKR